MLSVEAFNEPVARHSYSSAHMNLMISSILSAISLRGASRVIRQCCAAFELDITIPTWTTTRLWLLKLGLHKLTREKPIADDWVWIVDHTVQWGSEKCLLIVGLRLKTQPKKRALQFADLEPIALFPVKQSNGSIVYEQLQEAAKKTGVPRAIISDGGPDLKSGIDQFITETNYTVHIYDITHRVALCFKSVLEADPNWNGFIELAASAQKYMCQTDIAALSPPNQRSKARYMNIDLLVRWARKIAMLSDDVVTELFDLAQKKRCLGWLDYYQKDIDKWYRMVEVAESIVSWIQQHGIYRGVTHALREQLSVYQQAHCEQSLAFQENVLQYVTQSEYKTYVGECLPGSSDCIESLFGRFKHIEKQQAASGFTSLLLALPAMIGKTSVDITKQAMEKIRVDDVWEWFRLNVGQSVQSKRVIAFNYNKKEQI